jgi:hypothetical protein
MEALILFSGLGIISTIALIVILWYQYKHKTHT